MGASEGQSVAREFHNPPHWVSTLNDPNTLSAFLGGFIVLYGFVSFVIKQKMFISESIVATAVGIIAGPFCMNILDPKMWGDTPEKTLTFTYNFSQFICAIQIMAATVALPKAFWQRRWSSVAILLGPVMTYEYIATALLLWGILGVPFLDSLIISSCTAPTDPVLANAIINGRFADLHISPPVRYLLSGESAANDGLAIPMFMLPVLLLKEKSAGEAIAKWFYAVWVYEILGALVLGLIIGFIAQRLLQYSEMKRMVDKSNFLSFEIALALFVIGFGSMLGTASFLAVFAAGMVFSWDDWFHEKTKEAHVQEVLDTLLNISFFVYFGSIIPWNDFNTVQLPAWKLILTAFVVLVVRRLPIIFVLYRGLGGWFSYQEAFFVGWFGPVGVGALWYMAYGMLYFPDNPYIVPVVSFLVLSSVIIHGITVPFAHVTIVTARTVSISRSSVTVPRWPEGVPIDPSQISNPIIGATIISDSSDETALERTPFRRLVDKLVENFDPFSRAAIRSRRDRLRAQARDSNRTINSTVEVLDEKIVSSDQDITLEGKGSEPESSEIPEEYYEAYNESYGLPLGLDFAAGPPASYERMETEEETEDEGLEIVVQSSSDEVQPSSILNMPSSSSESLSLQANQDPIESQNVRTVSFAVVEKGEVSGISSDLPSSRSGRRKGFSGLFARKLKSDSPLSGGSEVDLTDAELEITENEKAALNERRDV